MGHGEYSFASRALREQTVGYHTKSRDDIFQQNREHRIHDGMNPKGIKVREARDSAEHPATVPVQLYLDVTGSMQHIPHELINNGLTTLVGKIIQSGVKDVALMFGAIGDHECDRAPLQVGQFESGDAEMDMWLERTWLEGNGGGNAGESYLLAWYFAGHHVSIDAFEKRGKKGFLFTIGDEPCLPNLPASAVKAIMGETGVGQGNYTREQLLEKAKEQNHVFHIHVDHGGRRPDPAWKEMLGQNFVVIDDHQKVAQTISDIVLSHVEQSPVAVPDPVRLDDGTRPLL